MKSRILSRPRRRRYRPSKGFKKPESPKPEPKISQQETNPLPALTKTCLVCGRLLQAPPRPCTDVSCTERWRHVVQNCYSCSHSWIAKPFTDIAANYKDDLPCNSWKSKTTSNTIEDILNKSAETSRKKINRTIDAIFVLVVVAFFVIVTWGLTRHASAPNIESGASEQQQMEK